MTAFTEKLDRAAGAATCAVLEIGGASLIGSGVVGLAAGGTGVVPLAAGAAAVMASSFLGCSWDPNQGEPTNPYAGDFCYEGASPFSLDQFVNDEFIGGSTGTIKKILKIEYQSTETCNGSGSRDLQKIFWEKEGGSTGDTTLFTGGPCNGNVYTLEQVWEGDPTCEVPGPPPPVIDIPPFEYTDPEDGCQLTVNFQGFGSGAGGNASPVFKIEPNAATRAESGDVIGGCNFEPVIYMRDPNGGPPYVGPWNPDWDQPDSPPFQWEEPLKDTANICSNEDVLQYLKQLLVNPFGEQRYALNSICELDEDGNPTTRTVERQIPSLPPLPSIATRLDALVPLLQAQKDFKQPVCPPVKSQGDLRTIGFISENYSPNGRNNLRKRLRYRSMSGIGLDALIDYWKDFEFDAGPVIVKHVGSSWGTVTVWAASIAEGKRVIRHAAGEASIDADQVGRWEICSSTSTRLGMPGRMKVNKSKGFYWITERDGASGRPLVGEV